jgi:cytochrome c-type biogenesis protein CcmF
MNVAAPGELLIWFALVFNLVSGFAFAQAARGQGRFESLGIRAWHILTTAALLASVYLYYLIFTDNFAFRYVWEYSASTQEFFYKLAAFWAGQAGTYLLWLVLNALFGYQILRHGGRYTQPAMTVLSLVNLFLLVLMVKVSPFEVMPFFSPDGAGLNPLLKDPWMVVHPPVIFVGYSMAGVAFAIAMAALLRGRFDDWAQRVFPWVAMTALMLGAGNILGGYWAYKTLGWGGYWAWDPVENSSFIPWLVSLALLHGLIIERHTGAFRRTNLLLTAFVFVLVVYGTFLTRSGVLANFSVHSFVDLGQNSWLAGFLIGYLVLSLVLFAWRAGSTDSRPFDYNFFTRRFSLFAGMMLLVVFSLIVLFWTSLPLLTMAFTDNPRAADVATYNSFALPFAVLYCLFLAFAPMTSGAAYSLKNWSLKLVVVGFAMLLISFGVFYFALGQSFVATVVIALAGTSGLIYLLHGELFRRMVLPLGGLVAGLVISVLLGVREPMSLALLAVAAMAIVANAIGVVRVATSGWRAVGAQVSHMGFALMVIGVLASSAYVSSEKLVIDRGGSGAAFGREVVYRGMEHDITQPRNRLILDLSENGKVTEARPELYFSERMKGLMKRPFIKKELLYDLYMSPEQIQDLDKQGAVVIRQGQTRRVADYAVTFERFGMDEHTSGDGDVRVVAHLTAVIGGDTVRLEPALVMEQGSQGFSEVPAPLPGNPGGQVVISDILADQKAVVLAFPGVTDQTAPDRLVLDVSKRPLINLVWLGTTIILLGGLVVYVRRFSDVSR